MNWQLSGSCYPRNGATSIANRARVARSAELRSIALADAIRLAFGTSRPLRNFVSDPRTTASILEINEAGSLSPTLQKLPGHVPAIYPNVDMHAMPYASDRFDIPRERPALGTADLLLGDPETARGVVDHLDAHAAGQVILELIGDVALRERMAEATRRLAKTSFLDMETYVSRLDAIGTAAASRMVQRSADAETLLGDLT